MLIIQAGRLFILDGQGAREHVSPFAQERVESETRQQERNAWRAGGEDDNPNVFSRGMLWAGKGTAGKPLPPKFETAQRVGSRLYYVLAMSKSRGLFYYDLAAGKEIRLFHKEEFQPHGLFVDEDFHMFSTRTNADQSVNLVLLDQNGKEIKVLTTGDCVDEHPFKSGDHVWYQTAGIGRNEQGMACAFTPIGINSLDLASGRVTEVVHDPARDFLLPKADREGRLYYIRRPHQEPNEYPWSAFLWDVVLFPYRLAVGVFGFLDVFTRLFGKTGLKTAGGPLSHELDVSRRIILGRLVDIQKASKTAGRKVAVPGDWELIRRAPDGREETVAAHVAWYDFTPDGRPVWTNGFEILSADGPRPYAGDEIISQIGGFREIPELSASKNA